MVRLIKALYVVTLIWALQWLTGCDVILAVRRSEIDKAQDRSGHLRGLDD